MRLPFVRHRLARVPVVAALGVVALLAAACGGSGSPAASSSSKSTTRAHTGASTGTSTGAATVDLASVGGYGSVLVTSTGRTLYLLTADTNGTSACTGACTGVWPPLITHGAPVAGTGVTASLLGTISRPGGGGTQITYGGHPLYTYSGDTASGQAHGQGIYAYGGYWYVVGASGKAVTSSGSSSTTSGGYGY